jgi:hypothetical protein
MRRLKVLEIWLGMLWRQLCGFAYTEAVKIFCRIQRFSIALKCSLWTNCFILWRNFQVGTKEFSFGHQKVPSSDETVYSDNTCPYSTYQDLRLAEIQYFISTFLLVYYWKCCHLIGYLLSVLDRKQVAKQLFSLNFFLYENFVCLSFRSSLSSTISSEISSS